MSLQDITYIIVLDVKERERKERNIPVKMDKE